MTTKLLIVAYSWSGNTATMATALQKVTGADRIDLTVAADTFSTDMYATSDIANQQLASGNMPALTNATPDLAQYQTILVGGPVWSAKVATPVRTFLSQLSDYHGTVMPFYTDAGTPGSYEVDFDDLVTAANVKPGIGLSSGQLASAATILRSWWEKAK
ncbi:flavodoxin [Lactiplantibacillus sp. WILCCON 0030]|uniref:Flavodoxin n=1 Tax=Lactiplantibacillus brownii TaxID=3069269 RepID=A0ABU1AAI2_9LACO|nr:flavodoxin [Lactiplantibacillus brownii]MDQ7937986.1 flavodoxin [Lactiplantibacillus brownii]